MANFEPDNYNFVEKLPDDLNCGICTNLLAVPVQIECCGVLYCKTCLQDWLKKKRKTCPHCRSTDSKYIKDSQIKRQIDNLAIYCPNRSKGCKTKTTVSRCSSHLKTCSYEEVSCSIACGSRMQRKKLKKHESTECPKRTVHCQYCEEQGMHESINSLDHWIMCPSLPLDCPNNCGHDKIQRKDLPDHQKVCPLEPVECPFFEAGCKQEITRKELAAHKAANIENHLELTMLTATNNTRRLNQVSLKFRGLASCVTKQLVIIEPTPQNAPAINNIKTAIEAMTKMLDQDKQYCLQLVTYGDTIRSPSFYIKPGYKMYVNSSKQIILEKGEHDNGIEWPMPEMNIQLRTVDNIILQTLNICSHCGITVNKITGEHREREIRSPSDPGPAHRPLARDEVLIEVFKHNCTL